MGPTAPSMPVSAAARRLSKSAVVRDAFATRRHRAWCGLCRARCETAMFEAEARWLRTALERVCAAAVVAAAQSRQQHRPVPRTGPALGRSRGCFGRCAPEVWRSCMSTRRVGAGRRPARRRGTDPADLPRLCSAAAAGGVVLQSLGARRRAGAARPPLPRNSAQIGARLCDGAVQLPPITATRSTRCTGRARASWRRSLPTRRLLDGTIIGAGLSYRDDVRRRPWILLRHLARFSGAVSVVGEVAAVDGQALLARGRIPASPVRSSKNADRRLARTESLDIADPALGRCSGRGLVVTPLADARPLSHIASSPAARKVRIVLYEKNLDFTLKAERTWERRPEFLALGLAGEVPVLIEPDSAPCSPTRRRSSNISTRSTARRC